jgi:hypothetical protein
MKTSVQLIAPAVAILVPVAIAGAEGSTHDVQLDGVLSFFGLGDPANVVMEVDIGQGSAVAMTGVGWDLTLTTIGGSWANEASMAFSPSDDATNFGLFLTPGFNTGSPVSGGANYTSSILKLGDVNIPDIVLSNGILRIEFFESFIDDPAGPDATWDGTLTIQYGAVPAPGALALLALGGIVGMRRRRR